MKNKIKTILFILSITFLPFRIYSQWTTVVPGVEYRKFTSSTDGVQPSPNEVFVVRISRSQADILLDVGVGNGEIRDVRETVSGIATRYENITNYNGQQYDIVAAVNGDFFSYDTDQVIGGQVILGTYADKMGSRGKFAFKNLSSVFIDRTVSFSGKVTFADGSQADINDINVPRGTDQLILYTFHYDSATFTNEYGCEVVVGYVNEPLSPNREVSGVVREIRSGIGSAPIPFDGFVLSGHGAARTLLEQKCKVGDVIKVKLSITSSAGKDWTGVYSAIEGAQWFVSNGQLTSDLWEERHPRTAVAYNDNYIYLIVCDGRRSTSIGMKLSELGNFCIQYLQAKEALNLDGGGSSTMWVNGSVKNQPSDGTERAVANALLVAKISSAKSTKFSSFEVAKVNATANMRLGPGTNFGVLRQLSQGTYVTVLPNPLNGVSAKGYYWWKVRYGNYEGWIAETLLDKVSNISIQYPRLSWDSVNASSHSMVITFNSTSSIGTPVVWWGTVQNYPLFSTSGSSFWSSACSRYINTIKLTGLPSEKTFYYITGSPNYGWSTQSSFTVGPPIGSTKNVRFVFASDTRTQLDIVQQVYNKIAARSFDVLLFGGDIVATGTDQTLWDSWFNIYKGILSKKPFFSCDANHENSAANLFDQFVWPNNEKWYSFNYGNVHITYLQVKTETSTIPEGSEQYNWLASDLQQAASDPNIKWKFVVFHAPPYAQGGGHTRNSLIVPTACKLFQQYGVDLVFNGHVHLYDRSYKVYQPPTGGEIISERGPSFYSTTEGVIYVTAGSAGAPLYTAQPTTWTAIAVSKYNYALIDIDNINNKLTLTAYDINDVVIDSFTITKVPAVPPSAPTNVKVSYNESGYACVLSWSSVSGATAYDVRIRPSGGSWSYVYDLTSPNANNIGWPAYYYVVPSSGSYDFSVRSKNAAGTSSWVDVLNVSFPEYIRPVTPTNVKAIALSTTSIRISWDAVPGVSGYTIYCSTDKTKLENLCVNILPTGSTNWTNLNAITDGSRANSPYASANSTILTYVKVPFATALPVHKLYFRLWDGDNRIYKSVRARYYDANDNVVELDTSTRAVRTEWCYRLNPNNDVISKGVGVMFSQGQGNTTNSYNHITEIESYGGFLTKVNTTSFDHTNLQPDTEYFYRVDAYKVVGNRELISDSSVIVSTKTLAIIGAVPQAPTNLTGVAISSISISLSWTDNSNNETGFKIERKTEGGTYTVISTVPANSTSYTDTGLQHSTTYYYRVFAYNSYGNSSYSNEVRIVTLPQGTADVIPPQNPTYCRAWNNQTKTIEVFSSVWQNKVDKPYFEFSGASDNLSGVSGYSVYWGTSSVGEPGFVKTLLHSATVSYTPATPAVSEKPYYFRVRTVDNSGNWSQPTTLFVLCYDNTNPQVVNVTRDTNIISPNNDNVKDNVNVSYTLTETSSVTVKITNVQNNLVKTIKSQVVEQKGIQNFLWDGTDTNNTTVPDGKYKFVIEAIDLAGNTTSYSSEIIVDLTAPSEIVDLTAENLGGGDISVHWAESTDNNGIWYYEIYRNNVLISTMTTTNFIDSGSYLVDKTTYTYKVVAVDLAGNKNYGNTVEIVCDKSGVAVKKFVLSNNGYFSPNNDGVNDVVQIKYELASPATVSLYITDSNGIVVYSLEDSVGKNANVEYQAQWDGKELTGLNLPDGKYNVVLSVLDPNLLITKKRSLETIIDTKVDIGEVYVNPYVFSPNNDGFEDTTAVYLRLLEPVYTKISVVDINDIVVKTLVNNMLYQSGNYTILWDGKDENNAVVPNGKYNFKIQLTDIAQNTTIYLSDVHVDTINGKLCGYVYEDNAYGEIPENVVPNAQCVVVETGDSAITDSSGYFLISRLPAGEYTFVVFKQGYQHQTLSVTISAGKITQLNIRLKKDYSVNISTISPPQIEHYPVNVVGLRNNKIKLIVHATDENSKVKSVKMFYRLKLYGEWYEWIEKECLSLDEEYYLAEILPEEIPKEVESIEYKIVAENENNIIEGTEEYNIEVQPEVSSIIGKQGGSLTLPDGNPDDGECKIEVLKGTLDRNIKFTFKEVDRKNVPQHQDRTLVYSVKPVACYEITADKKQFENYITIKLLYLDLDNDGKEDVYNTDETKLKLWWYDNDIKQWRYIGGNIDKQSNTITAKVQCLGIFGIFPTQTVDGGIFRPKERIVFLPAQSSVGTNLKGVLFNGISNSNVVVNIYDIKGRKVKTLVSEERWDCTDDTGKPVDSGVYIYQYEFEGKRYQGTIVVGR